MMKEFLLKRIFILKIKFRQREISKLFKFNFYCLKWIESQSKQIWDEIKKYSNAKNYSILILIKNHLPFENVKGNATRG